MLAPTSRQPLTPLNEARHVPLLNTFVFDKTSAKVLLGMDA